MLTIERAQTDDAESIVGLFLQDVHELQKEMDRGMGGMLWPAQKSSTFAGFVVKID